MTPTFSLLHASFGRPEKAIATRALWISRATDPDVIEYIFALNSDDPTDAENLRVRCLAGFATSAENLGLWWPRFVVSDFHGSAPAWDAAAKESNGNLLVQVSDDFVPPQNYDQLILDAIVNRGGGLDWDTKAIVVRVGEHFRRDDLMTMFVCSRAYYKLQGYFLFPEYRSVFSDDDATIRAVAAERDGVCQIIDARDVVFRHETAYHTGAEQDATLKRQNSPENYQQGAELFMRRNLKLVNAGLKTW